MSSRQRGRAVALPARPGVGRRAEGARQLHLPGCSARRAHVARSRLPRQVLLLAPVAGSSTARCSSQLVVTHVRTGERWPCRPHPPAQQRCHRAAGHTRSRYCGHPETLFTAEFMGSNNRVEGRVAEVDGSARLAGDSWKEHMGRRSAARGRAWPALRPPASSGSSASASPSSGRQHVAPCRWSRRCFSATAGSTCFISWSAARLRAYGSAPLPQRRHWLEIPRADFWVF